MSDFYKPDKNGGKMFRAMDKTTASDRLNTGPTKALDEMETFDANQDDVFEELSMQPTTARDRVTEMAFDEVTEDSGVSMSRGLNEMGADADPFGDMDEFLEG